jgi:hypothetical protein
VYIASSGKGRVESRRKNDGTIGSAWLHVHTQTPLSTKKPRREEIDKYRGYGEIARGDGFQLVKISFHFPFFLDRYGVHLAAI